MRITPAQHALIREIKLLYEEHDALEIVLVCRKRRGYADGEGTRTRSMWEAHDHLEREIVDKEAKLPHSIVEQLKAGAL